VGRDTCPGEWTADVDAGRLALGDTPGYLAADVAILSLQGLRTPASKVIVTDHGPQRLFREIKLPLGCQDRFRPIAGG